MQSQLWHFVQVHLLLHVARQVRCLIVGVVDMHSFLVHSVAMVGAPTSVIAAIVIVVVIVTLRKYYHVGALFGLSDKVRMVVLSRCCSPTR